MFDEVGEVLSGKRSVFVPPLHFRLDSTRSWHISEPANSSQHPGLPRFPQWPSRSNCQSRRGATFGTRNPHQENDEGDEDQEDPAEEGREGQGQTSRDDETDAGKKAERGTRGARQEAEPDGGGGTSAGGRKPAVGYVRMSTDQQQDSPARQWQVTQALAQRQGFRIIR